MQRGRPVGVRSVDRRLPRDERADGAGVPTFHGIDERRARGHRRHRQEQRGYANKGRSHVCNIAPNGVVACGGGASCGPGGRPNGRPRPRREGRHGWPRRTCRHRQQILCDLPQRPPQDRGADAGRRGSGPCVRARRHVGKSHPQAPHGRDAASRRPAARSGCLERARHVSRDVDRPGRDERPPPGQARARPSPDTHGIPERDSRSPGGRGTAQGDRLPAAAARRQLVERVRQHRGPPVRLARHHGAVPRRGGKDQPARSRRHEGAGDGQPLSAPSRAMAGRPRGRSAVGYPRRRRRQEPLPRRRRVRREGPALGAPDRTTPARDQRGRRAVAARDARRQRRGASERRAPAATEDRGGRSGPGARIPHPDQSGTAARRRDVHRARRGARRIDAAPAHARTRHGAGSLARHDQRTVWREGARGFAKPPAHLLVQHRQRVVREADPPLPHAPRVPTPGHRHGHPGSAAVLRERPERSRLRRRHRTRARTPARQPAVPVPRRARAPRRCDGHGVQSERHRARLAPVLLPVEQHPRRSAAQGRGAGPPERPGRPRPRSPPDASG